MITLYRGRYAYSRNHQSSRRRCLDRRGGQHTDLRKQDRGGGIGGAQPAATECPQGFAVRRASRFGANARWGGSDRTGARCGTRRRDRPGIRAVMDAVLLDTHIALWLDSGSAQLRTATRTAIDACWHNGGKVLLSSVSAWEIALLVDGGRIELDVPVAEWNQRFLDRPGVEALPLSHEAACRCYQFHQLEHRDPAD